jgi:hypothetical protein
MRNFFGFIAMLVILYGVCVFLYATLGLRANNIFQQQYINGLQIKSFVAMFVGGASLFFLAKA